MALSATIGITKTTATLSRLTCSLNCMAHVSAQTWQMLNVGDGNAIIHSEATPAMQNHNSLNLLTVLQLNMSHPLKSKSPFLAWKSFDSESCIGPTFDEERLVNHTLKFKD